MSAKKPALMNTIWLFLILLSITAGAFTGRMKETLDASFASAKSAVELAMGLIGIMAFWLGLMKVAEKGGLLKVIAGAVKPVMIRLFPDVPAEHPAMSAMIMNISANVLGLGNAATPMGIKAMMELDRLNPLKGRATDAMCLFLAINTSSVTILPLGVISIRAAAGATEPASIFIPTLIATTCSTVTAVIAAKLFAKYSREDEILTPIEAKATDSAENVPDSTEDDAVEVSLIGKIAALVLTAGIAAAAVYRLITAPDQYAVWKEIATYWLVPLIICGLLLFGYLRGVKVYEAATEGAKEGFQVAIKIIPFLVAILVAVGMFRASGAFDFLVTILNPATTLIGMPADALPMALIRPLSGSGALAVMSEVIKRAPDSFSSFLVSTLQGCTETTFYVLAVYFGAVGITRTRYALPVGLLADVAGIGAALIICHLMY